LWLQEVHLSIALDRLPNSEGTMLFGFAFGTTLDTKKCSSIIHKIVIRSTPPCLTQKLAIRVSSYGQVAGFVVCSFISLKSKILCKMLAIFRK
jgi:hypothetical protein